MGIFLSKVTPPGPTDQEIKNAIIIKNITNTEINNEIQNINNTMIEIVNRATMNVIYALAYDIMTGNKARNVLISISENSNSTISFEYINKAIIQIISDDDAKSSLSSEIRSYLAKSTEEYSILKQSLRNVTNLIYLNKDDSEIDKMAKNSENTEINNLKNNIKNIYIDQTEINTIIDTIGYKTITQSLLNSCSDNVTSKNVIDIDTTNANNNDGKLKINESQMVEALNTCIIRSNIVKIITNDIINKTNKAAFEVNALRVLREKELAEKEKKELERTNNIRLIIMIIIIIILIIAIYFAFKLSSNNKNSDLSE
jgi:hypothetical protein